MSHGRTPGGSTAAAGGVRRAVPADADWIVDLRRRAWQVAYGALFPVRFRHPRDVEVDLWRQRLAGPGSVTWAVDERLGFASAARADEPDLAPEVGALLALYVEPGAWGRGTGAALHATAVEWLADQGLTEAVLWVFAANGRARGFYERRGWRAESRTLERTSAEWPAPALRYRRGLVGTGRR